jgi:stage II sporulation protein D
VALGLARAAGAQGDALRVGLGEGLAAVELRAAQPVSVLDAATRRPLLALAGDPAVRVTPAEGGGLEVGGRRLPVEAVRLETRGGGLRTGGREYGGVLEVWRTGSGLALVNEVGLEEYVAGAVRAEMPERWPPEALRAMAVVARTYALYQRERNAGRPWHLLASHLDQQFAGRVPPGAPSSSAARATAGQVLTWDGRPLPAFYHADSGGVTEPAGAVFAGGEVPPLGGVRDDFSAGSPHATWAVTLPLAAVRERLRRGGIDVGDLERLVVLERTASLRVARIAVEGSRGRETVKGTEFRRLVGYDVLKSTLFVPLVADGAVRFEGRGWGHGVGLSQFGARGMAERGHPYAQILAHYYPGASLVTLR